MNVSLQILKSMGKLMFKSTRTKVIIKSSSVYK